MLHTKFSLVSRKHSPVNRKAILFHGTGAHPDDVWLPWLRRRLTERDYAVEAPHYPGLKLESIATFLPKVLANHTFDANTVLVGHSGGAALLLAILEHIDTRVDQAILVAGYCTQPNTEDEPVLQDASDWAGIRANVRDPTTSSTPAKIRTAATISKVAPCANGSAAPRSSATTATSETSTRRTSRSSSSTS